MIPLSIASTYAPHTLPLPGRPEMPGEERWACILHMQHNYLKPGPCQTPCTPNAPTEGRNYCGGGAFFPFLNNHLVHTWLLACYQVLAQAASLPRQPYAPTTLFLLQTTAICHCTLSPPHGYTRIWSQWLHDAAEVPMLLTR